MRSSPPVTYDDHGIDACGENTIVFLHGVGIGRQGWCHQLECATSAGWRFVAIDAPGFGGTPMPDQPGFAPHVDTVLAVLDHLDIKRAVLCGHSLGGMTAQEIYAQHADRVAGLVLSATSPAFGRPDGEFQKAFLKSRFEPFDQGMSMPAFARTFVPQLVGSNPSTGAVEEIIEIMSCVSVDAYRLAMRTITGFDQRENLAKIHVPTLLIAGEQDTSSPAPMMAKMASKITGADYVELPATGHMAPIENPGGFNHHLTNYLKSIGAK